MKKVIHFSSSRIARRLVLYVILASTFITVFTSVYQLYGIYESDIGGIELRLDEIRDSYSDNIASRVWIANQQELEQTLEGILRLSDIEYIEVYEGSELIARQGKLPETDTIEREFPLSYTFHNKAQQIGRIHITASLASTYQRLIDRAVNIIVSNAIKTFFISGFMLFLFYQLVVKHLQRITKYAEEINTHNLDRRIVLERPENSSQNQDEFDMLVDAVHGMQLNLSTSISQLSLSEKNLSLALNSMNDAVIIIDETGTVISFNKTAETLFGYHSDEIIGENVSRLMPESDASKHDGYLQSYLETGDAHVIGYSREVLGQHKNKETFPMRLSIAELPADVSGQRHFIGTCQDLTFIKQQEEQLHRSQKMDALGKLTGGVAHDYNNMLGVILGYADLLKDKLDDEPKLINYAEQIERAAQRGASLTKKLLSFSRHDVATVEKIDLNVLLQEQEDLLHKMLTVRIQLQTILADDIWPIMLNSSDLEDAILNISINAMHAMDDMTSGAKLSLRTSNKTLNALDALALNLSEGDYVQLSITDTGSGMDEVTKEKIFDPFFSTKGKKGTGLGLSQVFGFIKRAGGTITVYSEPGHGTEFIFYFPRCYDNDIDSTISSEENHIAFSGKEKILIVDDEEALCNLCSELLGQQGYQIFKAGSGKQALDILAHEDIDLMISDVIMPEMDGYQLATIAQEKYPEIRIQLVSGFSDERHIDMIDETLHQRLLYKPYNSSDLFKNIRDLLDNKLSLSSKKAKPTEKKVINSFEWTDNLSIGIPEIDKDHQVLLSLLNRCIDMVNENEKIEELDIILNELVEYTQYHFKREEKIMDACGYPHQQNHKKGHQLLISELNQYRIKYEQGELTVDLLLGFLTGWLKDHIMGGLDKDIGAYYNKNVKL